MTVEDGLRAKRPHAVVDWENADRLLHGLSARLGSTLTHVDTNGAEVYAAPYVGVFASAREADKAQRLHEKFATVAIAVGEALGNEGFSMLTGGCPGIVHAAQARFVRTRRNPVRQRSVGVRIKALEFEEPANPDLDIEIHALNFGSRLELMHRFCDGAIILPGGLGSLLELAYFLQYAQVARKGRGMPICVLPSTFWNPLWDLFARMQRYQTVAWDGDLTLIHRVRSVEEAMEIIKAHNGNAAKLADVLASAPSQQSR